jgi:hypothetical protein
MKVKANAHFGEASGYDETLSVVLDDVWQQYIPAVTRERPVKDEDGNLVLNDDGTNKVETVTVSEGRQETLEEAVTRELKAYVSVYDIEKAAAICGASVSVDITVRLSGTIDIDLEELEEYEDLNDEDDVAQLIGDRYDIDYDVERAVNNGDLSIDDWDVDDVRVNGLYDAEGEEYIVE